MQRRGRWGKRCIPHPQILCGSRACNASCMRTVEIIRTIGSMNCGGLLLTHEIFELPSLAYNAIAVPARQA